ERAVGAMLPCWPAADAARPPARRLAETASRRSAARVTASDRSEGADRVRAVSRRRRLRDGRQAQGRARLAEAVHGIASETLPGVVCARHLPRPARPVRRCGHLLLGPPRPGTGDAVAVAQSRPRA